MPGFRDYALFYLLEREFLRGRDFTFARSRRWKEILEMHLCRKHEAHCCKYKGRVCEKFMII